MSESTNSLLISAGILLVITLADPCVNSIVSAVRRALQRPPRTAEPETTVNVLERDAA
jgi:hypothetical protein